MTKKRLNKSIWQIVQEKGQDLPVTSWPVTGPLKELLDVMDSQPVSEEARYIRILKTKLKMIRRYKGKIMSIKPVNDE